MAVVGLHNVSVLEASFLGESHSPVSRPWGNQDRSTTRTSSLRQMWRELEGVHAVSRFGERERPLSSDVSNDNLVSPYLSEGRGAGNGDRLGDDSEVENESGQCPQGQKGTQDGHEDANSSSFQQSTAFGGAERERVRQVFREWGNSGLRGHASNVRLNNCSRAQWLGENERKRVRIVREWIEMTTQQRGTCSGGGEEQAPDIGSQIERVRDGLVVDHCEIGARRAIRRLCGRQALLDLLTRSERERKRELQGLLEQRPVSSFAHRNRIQSLLRGRFLRNGGFIQDKRPTSLAASELCLLRQRHTVSGLREGFLSRSDNYHSLPDSAQSHTSSTNDNYHRNGQTQANILQEVPDEISDEFESTNRESDIGGFHTDDLESNASGGISWQEFMAPVEERQEQVLENEEREQLPSTVEFIERRDHDGEDAVESWQGSNGDGWSQGTLGIDSRVQYFLPELHESEHFDPMETNALENFNWQEGSAQVEGWQELVTENDGSSWHQLSSVEFSEAMDVNSHESSHGWYQEIVGNDLQESHEEWHQNDIEETIENWLDGPSCQEVAPFGRINTFYSSDDNNGYSLELRELLSRRRVSNLLQSGFRESLNQLIQSYVERQASDEWALDSVPTSPAFREQHDQEQRSGDENAGDIDAVERTELVIPSLPVTHETLLDQDMGDAADWQCPNIHERPGIEWEIINELRIDMARLQQEMNNMQRMLEACLDMQLELQRSVRQELSAALNRSSGPAEACDDCLLKDKAQWTHVRKEVCCICCGSNVESLLCRCGHMSTCSNCAEQRNWSKPKENVHCARHP